MAYHNHIEIRDYRGDYHFFSFGFFDGVRYQRFEVKDVCVIDVYKHHAHSFDLKAFFYKDKYIFHHECYRSKKEVYRAIQSLLEDAGLK